MVRKPLREEPTLQTIIAITTTATFIGKAPTGLAQTESSWQVKLINSGSTVDILWADGDENFDNVFSDRANLTYS